MPVRSFVTSVQDGGTMHAGPQKIGGIAFDAGSGIKTVTATDNAGNTSTTTFTVTPDSAVPTAATVSYFSGITNVASVSVTYTNGTDGAGSGVASVQMQRAQSGYAGGVCTGFGAFTNIGALNPGSPYLDSTVGSGVCYMYQTLVTDNVGNVATFVSASIVKEDQVAPTGTIAATPLSPFSGTVALTGTTTDALSGVSVGTLKDDQRTVGRHDLRIGRTSCSLDLQLEHHGWRSRRHVRDRA